MKPVPQSHLVRRDGVYYFRRRVPLDLVSVVGRNEIKTSLRTTDQKEARQRARYLDLQWDATFEAARATRDPAVAAQFAGKRLSQADLTQLLQGYIEQKTKEFELLLRREPFADNRERLATQADIELGVQIVTNLDDPRAGETIDALARRVIGGAGGAPGDFLGSDAELGEFVRRAFVELSKRKLALIRGDHSEPRFDSLFAEKLRPRVRFGDLADQFLSVAREHASTNGISRKNSDRLAAYVTLIREIVGDDAAVADIDYDVCLKVRSTIARVPVNRAKIYGDLGIKEAIEAADREKRSRLSPLTQSQYLAAFRSILDLAAKKQLIPLNFADQLTPVKRDDVERQSKRRPFSLQQIVKFFDCEFYNQASVRVIPFEHDTEGGWRFWLPLLMLFASLRPNEACQLDVADVQQTAAGTWFVHVTDDGTEEAQGSFGKKTVKNAQSRRRVPLHPELLKLGFVKYVEQRRKLNEIKVFGRITPDKYGNFATYPCRRFREVFLPAAIQLEERQAMYSFRHSFRDALRRVKADHDTLHALGWSQAKLVSDHYGTKSDPDLLIGVVREIRYHPLDLSKLHVRKE